MVDALDAAAVENGGVQRLRRRALVLLPRARGGGQECERRDGEAHSMTCVERRQEELAQV